MTLAGRGGKTLAVVGVGANVEGLLGRRAGGHCAAKGGAEGLHLRGVAQGSGAGVRLGVWYGV